ncbi:hypothetical protein PRIPAC_77674 [Pristionchus pacificus]|uniref:G protein-coupled receptor n=1 Tax=Pristionchus pacificus TaxID=54126 RepID=A0A2A6C4K7_PRIPA|nr:hypothetical protein PRIPAC_77674 [Pristionchus pacificus]|eukprot:PDM73105.1 G protein-coupled receptor [Pristionchus pacificus]
MITCIESLGSSFYSNILFTSRLSFYSRSYWKFIATSHYDSFKVNYIHVSLKTVILRSLRSSCNILIGSCALFDVLHQLGTFVQFSQVFNGDVMTSRTCVSIMFIPAMGVVAGSFSILSIGIDRFLSVATPCRYKNTKIITYLAIHYLAIGTFSAYNAFLIFYWFRDKEVICNAMSLYHERAIFWWTISAIVVASIAVIVYMATWTLIKSRVYNDESDKLRRIFRTIALVTIFDMSGWALTQVFVASLSLFDISNEKRFCFATLAGVPVNLGIAVKSLIYYHTSSDYRNAINCQFRSIRAITPTVIPLHSVENGEES